MRKVPIRFAAAFLFAALATSAHAADYLCTSATGCSATLVANGKMVKIHCRQGDIVSSEGNVITKGSDGWIEV